MARWSPSPALLVRVHGALCIMWALLMVPSVLWWKESLIWVIIMSCYANFAGSMASLQAARADRDSPTREGLQRLDARVVELLRRVPEPSAHSDLYWSMVSLMRKREERG